MAHRLSVSAGRGADHRVESCSDGLVGLERCGRSVCFRSQYGVDAVTDRRNGRRTGDSWVAFAVHLPIE